MSINASLPKGTRDFLPSAMHQREFIVQTLKEAFKKYGFAAIETPALEKVETLTGKYGEEGDRLVFKLLPRGKKLNQAIVQNKIEDSVEEALRYDLTVPFARFVVQNQNELNFPFKRFQIQPVWRADRPQKGRYREFVQCDADAVGSTSLLQEIEFIALYTEVFSTLKLPITLRINNRKLLLGLAEAFGVQNRFTEFTVILDKMDKVGAEALLAEFEQKNFTKQAVNGFKEMFVLSGTNFKKLEKLKSLCGHTKNGLAGIEELELVLKGVQALNLKNVELDVNLARGLDYYTGAIFEVQALGVSIGSIGGGGRYDSLTGIFGKKNLPGIGISFGLDRIQLCMQELDLFPNLKVEATQILLTNFGHEEAIHSLMLAQALRHLGIYADVYPDAAKLKKQLDYAHKKQIEFVLLVGKQEIEQESYGLKNMITGEQKQLGRIEILELFNSQASKNYGFH
jgi:histidyl-tRNA synthetase